MQVTVTQGGTRVYEQLFDNSKTLDKTIAFLMQQPTGDAVTTVVNNTGHAMTFHNAAFPVEGLVRVANGIINRVVTTPRRRKATNEAANF